MLDDYGDRIREIELRVTLRGTSERATAEFLERAEEDIREMIDLCADVESDARETVRQVEKQAEYDVAEARREGDGARAGLAAAVRLLAALRAHPALRVALDDEGVENLPDLAFAVFALPLFDLLRQADDAARGRERWAKEELRRKDTSAQRAAERAEADAQRIARRRSLDDLQRGCRDRNIPFRSGDRKIDLARRIASARG